MLSATWRLETYVQYGWEQPGIIHVQEKGWVKEGEKICARARAHTHTHINTEATSYP